MLTGFVISTDQVNSLTGCVGHFDLLKPILDNKVFLDRLVIVMADGMSDASADSIQLIQGECRVSHDEADERGVCSSDMDTIAGTAVRLDDLSQLDL